MTKEEFIAELTKSTDKVRWYVRNCERIRTTDLTHCPLSWVASQRFPSNVYNSLNPGKAGRDLEIESWDITEIVVNADNEYNTELRKQLLKAANLI